MIFIVIEAGWSSAGDHAADDRDDFNAQPLP